MTSAQAGPGWIVKHNGSTISEVRDINGPGLKAETDDATNQSSAGFFREKVATLLDGGDFKFDCNYIPGDSSQIGLLTAMEARSLESFTVDQPSGGQVLAFSGRVTGWEPKLPKDKIATLDVTVTVSGVITAS